MAAEPYRGSIHIAAPPEVVFKYFTCPEALVRWLDEGAVLDPRPGGEFTVRFRGASVQGRYLEADHPRWIVISWGRAGSAGFPPGASTLEVTLIPDGEGTTVQLVHDGLPPSEASRHAQGWAHFLPRLAVAATGGDPGPDLT